MPAFRDLDDTAVKQLFEYLGSPQAARPDAAEEAPADSSAATRGPVVASGGAPGGLKVRQGNARSVHAARGPALSARQPDASRSLLHRLGTLSQSALYHRSALVVGCGL